MDIQWFQVLMCVAGLAIPFGLLVSAASDTAHAEKSHGVHGGGDGTFLAPKHLSLNKWNSQTPFTKTDRPQGFQCNIIDSDWFKNTPGTPPASDTLYVTLEGGQTTEFSVKGQELESGNLCSTGCMMTLSSGSVILAEWHNEAMCSRQRAEESFITSEGYPYSPDIQLAAMQYDDRGMWKRYVFTNGSIVQPVATPLQFLQLVQELSGEDPTGHDIQEQF